MKLSEWLTRNDIQFNNIPISIPNLVKKMTDSLLTEGGNVLAKRLFVFFDKFRQDSQGVIHPGLAAKAGNKVHQDFLLINVPLFEAWVKLNHSDLITQISSKKLRIESVKSPEDYLRLSEKEKESYFEYFTSKKSLQRQHWRVEREDKPEKTPSVKNPEIIIPNISESLVTRGQVITAIYNLFYRYIKIDSAHRAHLIYTYSKLGRGNLFILEEVVEKVSDSISKFHTLKEIGSIYNFDAEKINICTKYKSDYPPHSEVVVFTKSSSLAVVKSDSGFEIIKNPVHKPNDESGIFEEIYVFYDKNKKCIFRKDIEALKTTLRAELERKEEYSWVVEQTLPPETETETETETEIESVVSESIVSEREYTYKDLDARLRIMTNVIRHLAAKVEALSPLQPEHLPLFAFLSMKKIPGCGPERSTNLAIRVAKECRKLGAEIKKVPDVKFGEINSYPIVIMEGFFSDPENYKTSYSEY